ncbi:MAG: ROK family protein [Mariprofundaceae bacterium]|nr:ROK family protein [Mariprofundaceae bacterium]
MHIPTVLGVDVGGTNIRLAVVNAQGEIGERVNRQAELSRLNGEDAAQHVLDTLSNAILPLLEKHPEITAIGIGFPGFFDCKTGYMIASPNIPGLRDFPLGDALHQQLKRSVHVQNDASLAALGEFRFGAVQGLNALLHLTLGTGIGGGAVINQQLYTGDGGMAMEIGHLQIAPADKTCGCGRSGCLETWASASAVAKRFNEKSDQPATAQEICRLADQGNVQALDVLHTAGMYLGMGIAEAVKLFDIRHVSISGGLTGAWAHISKPIKQALDAHLIPPLCGKVQVFRSSRGDDAGILGAAALALDSEAQPNQP